MLTRLFSTTLPPTCEQLLVSLWRLPAERCSAAQSAPWRRELRYSLPQEAPRQVGDSLVLRRLPQLQSRQSHDAMTGLQQVQVEVCVAAQQLSRHSLTQLCEAAPAGLQQQARSVRNSHPVQLPQARLP